MASPYFNGPVITLAAADSPFNKLIEIARLQTVILTAGAGAAATLNLYADIVTTNAPKQILSIQTAQATSFYVAFPLFDQTPFTTPGSQRWLSASVSGTGAIAFIYLS